MNLWRERWIPVTLGLGALVLAGLVYLLWPLFALFFQPGRQLKAYYIPSESMRPTLEIGDRIIPRDLAAGEPRRGDVIVFRSNGQVRVSRVAAIAGDTVALNDGAMWLNGAAVPQRAGGRVADRSARRLIEQLPGERSPHAVFDQGASPGDNFGPVDVPAGHLFVLGDNRDNSADSRFPVDAFGVGMVPVTDVIGRVDFVAWSSSQRGRFARPITRLNN